MSTTTTNYGLVKPALTDPADITAMNSNWDKIDSKFKSFDNSFTNVNNKLGTANKFNATEIIADTNLNNIITPGVYKCSLNTTASTLVNCPTSGAFSMLVLAHADNSVTQIIYEYKTNAPKVYFRNKCDTSYSTWAEFYTENTGTAYFRPDGNFRGVGKYRTINNTNYLASFGCYNYNDKGVAAIEIGSGANGSTFLGRLEVRESDVVYVDKNNRRHSMVNNITEYISSYKSPTIYNNFMLLDTNTTYDTKLSNMGVSDRYSFYIKAPAKSSAVRGLEIQQRDVHRYYTFVTKRYSGFDIAQKYSALGVEQANFDIFDGNAFVLITLTGEQAFTDTNGVVFYKAYVENPSFKNYIDSRIANYNGEV